MGLLRKITALGKRRKETRKSLTEVKTQTQRQCRFEVMEPRIVLSADPVIAGVTYLEGDSGQDTTPDHFEVTFAGGSDTTQLTQFVINGDQDGNGQLSDGDVFFDVGEGLPGTGGHHEFIFDALNSQGVAASDVVNVNVSDNGLILTVDVENFEAGDIFAFTIDVDEVENLNIDKIASGVEFEGSQFTTTFEDEHFTFVDKSISVEVDLQNGFIQNQTEGIFYDYYDQLLEEAESVVGDSLNLERDNETGQADRTAASVDAFDLVPKPITIAGTVYEDANLSWELDAGDNTISDVEIQLQKLNDAGQYETVATTQTDAQGNYEFGLDLNLTPGTYQLVEIQSADHIDLGAHVGSVEGEEIGEIATDANENNNVITNIHIPLGNTAATDYDFKEVRPVSISGHVYHDRNDDGQRAAVDEGISNVLIMVTRVDDNGQADYDPFADTAPIFVRTDANGFYSVDGLPPGVYQVMEINNYPNEVSPLADFIDGQDRIGTVNGVNNGEITNDKFNNVDLSSGEQGVNYDFGEIIPAMISGYVSLSTPEGHCDPNDPNHNGIAGVTIQLFGEDGSLITETTTNEDGFYKFNDLRPGTYSVVEVQPEAYLDGEENIGNVDGTQIGQLTMNDRFDQITLTSDSSGVMYNFCEHIPAEIHGTVYHDQNDDGIIQADEQRLGGVTVQLFDEAGNMVDQTQTDAQGNYWFTGLEAGQYKLTELQPTGFADGKDTVGNIDGVRTGEMVNDMFLNIDLQYGDVGVEYNFGELRLASISGMVHGDANGNCTFEPDEGDQPLEGVVLQLFNEDGELVAETTTDAEGNYLFDGLRPGTYSVREVTPDGFIDGAETVGTVDGDIVGQSSDDRFFSVTLESGDQGVNYDFCEHIPAEIHGRVYHDINNDGRFQNQTEHGISGVTIQLFDDAGNLVEQMQTDSDGAYWFTNLMAGTYKVQELQPDDYSDGIDRLGTVDGVNRGETMNDMHSNIELNGGDRGIRYDFGEIRLASISGFVHVDMNGNCTLDANSTDEPLANVTLELLDADGQVIGTTQTNSDGFYEFDNLLPGTYSVRQQQPTEFFDGDALVGSDGGDSSTNLLSDIVIDSGQQLTQYNFCEHPAAEIHGRVWFDGPAFETSDGEVPDDYRDQRDTIFNEGTDTPLAGVTVSLYYYIDPELNDIAPRPVTIGDVLASEYTHLGTDPSTPISAVTDADGRYWFTGLQAGNYLVLEEQPEGYVDANDVPGTTTGFSVNSTSEDTTAGLRQFTESQRFDSIANIFVQTGQASFENNFTEVAAIQSIEPDLPTQIFPQLNPPPTTSNPLTPNPGIQGLPGLFGAQGVNTTTIVGGGLSLGFFQPGDAQEVAAAPYSWHLSIVNGGQPPAEGFVDASQSVWRQASFISETDWNRFDMSAASWVFTETRSVGDVVTTGNSATFGMVGGTPLAGDFDGDGSDEIAVFKDGYWMIDLNHNGRWDEADLLATLGDAEDRPVVGDWDGDGKDDIGIYGPIWERDPLAISRDPGLPNPDNDPDTKPKNIPPIERDATNGARVLKLTNFGSQRVDVVDHVFGTGDRENTPIAGDWNGNGIRSIGYFNAGTWQFDVNGDGKFDFEDSTTQFGRSGDLPLVGDFNGDGIEEIAVYRSGTWLIDTNGNRQLDATDKTFQLGGATDKPVVGDFDGDGIDEPGLYRESTGSDYRVH